MVAMRLDSNNVSVKSVLAMKDIMQEAVKLGRALPTIAVVLL